jgi:peptidoglycan/xylan/chitin deacetylase (PgdA/CDA1 family)
VSFDDVPRSATVTGAEILESRGVRGTFYVAAGLVGSPPEDPVPSLEVFRSLADRGHEIGCHTHAHPDVAGLDPRALGEELDRNARALAAAGCPALVSFAYPYGSLSLRAKRMVGTRFASGRGIRPGVNRGRIDLALLRARSVYRTPAGGPDPARLLEGLERGGWVVLYTHDVRPDPSPFGCHPDDLRRTVDAALALGAEILPVGAAVRRLSVPTPTSPAGGSDPARPAPTR